MKTLADIFKHSLKEMYYVENMLVPALRRIADAVTNDQLKVVIEEHIEETTEHVELLRRVFPLIGTIADGEKCLAVEGLIEQADVEPHRVCRRPQLVRSRVYDKQNDEQILS